MKENICTIPKDLFKPFFDTLKVITRSIEVHVEDGLVWLVASDAAHTTMVRLRVQCTVVNPFIFKIDLDKIGKMAIEDDFNLYHDDNIMIVKSGSTNYKIPIIADANVRTYDFKEFEYEGTIALSKDDIKKIVQVINYVKTDKDTSESLWFTLSDSVFKIQNRSNTVDHTFEGLITTGSGKSLFSLDLIEGMYYAYAQYETFSLSLNTDRPCMLKMQRDGLCAEIIIAPRIDDDE